MHGIPVVKVVRGELIMPAWLARVGIEGHERIGVEVVSFTVIAVTSCSRVTPRNGRRIRASCEPFRPDLQGQHQIKGLPAGEYLGLPWTTSRTACGMIRNIWNQFAVTPRT